MSETESLDAIESGLRVISAMLWKLQDEIRPDTAYLRGEIGRLHEQVDILSSKVEKERLMQRDKDVLL